VRKRTLVEMEESKVEVEKTETAQDTLARLEQEKMTRRQALGRLGFLAGAAAVSALTVDELTRKVGQEMSRRAGDNKIVAQVAKEFENAGIANAGTRLACSVCAVVLIGPDGEGTGSANCGNPYCACRAACPTQFNIFDPGARGRCLDRCKVAYTACLASGSSFSGFCPTDPVDCQC
jgi:hypothetical protein